MSYASIAQLAKDPAFQDRVKAAATIECQHNLDNPGRADWSNLAYDTLRNADHTMDSFIRFVAQTPGIADIAGDPPDQSLITDSDLAVAIDDCYPVVASLWYNPDGSPWGGALHLPTDDPHVEHPIVIPPEEPPPVEPPVEPTITGVSPISGTGGTTVTVTGTGLTGTIRVQIEMDCPDLTVVDDFQVTASVPTGVHKGRYPVIVTVNSVDLTGPEFQVT